MPLYVSRGSSSVDSRRQNSGATFEGDWKKAGGKRFCTFLIAFQSSTLRLGAMRILVVEDEHRLADLLRRALEHERHQVEIAYDGAAGLERAAVGELDLLIL